MMHSYNIMGGMYGFGSLFNILVIGLIILVYLWVIKLWKEISRK